MPQQRRDNGAAGFFQTFENGEMVVRAIDDAASLRIQPLPDLRHQSGLPNEFGPFAATNPSGQAGPAVGQHKGWAFLGSFGHVQLEGLIHLCM